MTPCEPGDVVLVRFPFTDLASAKKRPAVVLSPAEYSSRHGDVVLLALTSRPQPENDLQLRDWKQAGLLKPTWLKPLIATVQAGVVVRHLGQLVEADWPRAANALERLIARGFLPTATPPTT